jgi:CelD/BcsL family acetyltransferase involved in cellulose biosynthesis
MLTVTPLSHLDPKTYDTFITDHPATTIYHTRAWLKVLQLTYGYAPASLVALDGEQVVGVLPLMRISGIIRGRRLVSLPFSHCVPILATHPDAETALLNAAIDLARREDFAYLELKPRQPIQHPDFLPSTLNHISELSLLPEPDALFEAFTPSNRRNIRKAEKAGFILREATTYRDFDSFHAIEVATRHRQGAPVYPKAFFQHAAEHLRKHLHLYLLSMAGQDVAGMLVFQMGGHCIYGYGAALRSENLKGLHPSNWLIWHAIQQARAAGCTLFDFGTTPIHNTGLLEFKQRYNPTTQELPYWYFLHTRRQLPLIQRDSRSIRFIEMILRWMPRPLFARLTPLLLREVG